MSRHPSITSSQQDRSGPTWRLEEAEARFSEVVRRARSEGPQRVSVRGRDAVVVMAADMFDRLLQPEEGDGLPFVAFMESLACGHVDLAREDDRGIDTLLAATAVDHDLYLVTRNTRPASGFKAQLDTSEQASVALKTRCDAAEARTAMAEQRASALERASAQAAAHAALAESLSTKLHDKVVSAFGIGSRAHPVLEVVATQQAAD